LTLPQTEDRSLIRKIIDEFKDEFFFVVVATVAAVVRAMGVKVESGQTGLLFSFGRVSRTLDHGFHFLIPFLQKARKIPTRSRTLDLRAQRVTTFEGLVYHVEGNLVYRVVDIAKALIQIDVLEKGMLEMLGLGVQEVLRSENQASLKETGALDTALSANLAKRLEPWGVEVERAGFTSITPSKRTLRVTQLEQVTLERERMLGHMEQHVSRSLSLGLIGMRAKPISKTRYLRGEEVRRRRQRRLRSLLMRQGWLAIQIEQARRRLRARASATGLVRVEAKVGKKDKGKGKARRNARLARGGVTAFSSAGLG
jgi:hypothetical protein